MSFGGAGFRNLAASYQSRSGRVDFKGRTHADSYAEIALPPGPRAPRRSPTSLNGIPRLVRPGATPHVEEHRGRGGVMEPSALHAVSVQGSSHCVTTGTIPPVLAGAARAVRCRCGAELAGEGAEQVVPGVVQAQDLGNELAQDHRRTGAHPGWGLDPHRRQV